MALSETPPPALQAELCPADAPLALLPVRLETRFFAVSRRYGAAHPGLSGQDPPRFARGRADRRRAPVGRALLGAMLARGRHSGRRGSCLASARRALWRSARRLDRARAAARQPGRPADRAGAARPAAGAAAGIPRGRDGAGRRGRGVAARAARAPAAGALDSGRLSSRRRRAHRDRARHHAAARRGARSEPGRAALRPRATTSSRSTPACAGWSTSTKPRRAAWGSA